MISFRFEPARLHDLLAAEGEELPRERSGALGRAPDLLDVGTGADRRAELVEQQIRVAEDRGQDVVEVVRDAAGEPAHRFHLLRLAQLHLAVPQRLLDCLRSVTSR